MTKLGLSQVHKDGLLLKKSKNVIWKKYIICHLNKEKPYDSIKCRMNLIKCDTLSWFKKTQRYKNEKELQ